MATIREKQPGVWPASPRSIQTDFAPGLPRHLFSEWILPGVAQADVVIHAIDREFDPVARLPHDHYQVGPLNLRERETEYSSLRPDAKPWGLVSISTEAQGETDIVVDAVEALRGQPVQILGTAPGRSEDLRRQFPGVLVKE